MEQHQGNTRRHPRHELPAVVNLSCENVFAAGHTDGVPEERRIYLVKNLSIGGALIAGGHPFPVGSRVNVVLELAGEAPFTVNGTVVRQQLHHGKKALALAFDEMSMMNSAIFDVAINRCLEAFSEKGRAYVLVLESDDLLRKALARDIERLGRKCVSVKSPTSAISLLEANEPSFEAAVVDLHLGSLTPDGTLFSEFLAQNYPWVRRILTASDIDEEELERAAMENQAQKTLRKPWSEANLREVLG